MRFLLAAALALLASTASAAPHNSAKLFWTAAGDDSIVGRAAQVDVRFATFPITAANFLTATRYPAPPPSAPGLRDSVEVTGLLPATLYYFAMKTADEVPNWSGLSNVVSKTTAPAPDTTPPAARSDLQVR